MSISPLAASDAVANAITARASGADAAVEDAEDSNGAISSDFETFLQLLTAQLNNQDPLKPLESTEFVAQLAQFSAVEQQVRSNDTLDQIFDAVSGGASGLAQWLGAEVSAPAALRFSGAPISLTTTPDQAATAATLVVRTEAGDPVARVQVEPTATSVVWDGSTTAGGVAPEGFYRFTVERSANGDPLPIGEPSGFARVVEARVANGSAQLILEGGDVVAASEVSAIRLPPDES